MSIRSLADFNDSALQDPWWRFLTAAIISMEDSSGHLPHARVGTFHGHRWIPHLATSGYFILATDNARNARMQLLGQGGRGGHGEQGEFNEGVCFDHPNQVHPSRATARYTRRSGATA